MLSGAELVQTAPHGYIYEHGTTVRANKAGANRGRMGATPTFFPIAEAYRRQAIQDVIFRLYQHGASTVSGSADEEGVMAIKTGRYGKVFWDAAGGTTFAEVISLNAWSLDAATELEDVTCFGDTTKVYIPGMPDAKGEIGGFWNSADYDALEGREQRHPRHAQARRQQPRAGLRVARLGLYVREYRLLAGGARRLPAPGAPRPRGRCRG